MNDIIAVGFAQYNQAGIDLSYRAGSQIPGFNAVGPIADQIDAWPHGEIQAVR